MTKPLGIIAGQGDLPLSIAKNVMATGGTVFCVRVEGLADTALDEFSGKTLNLGALDSMYAALREAGCEKVLFAGYITRPDFAAIAFDDAGQALLPEIMRAAALGDNAVLGVFIKAFEIAGFQVVGGQEAYPELLCPEECLTQRTPEHTDVQDMEKAFSVAGIMGAADIGQGCVVRGGVVLAVEAQEGTDAMIRRAGQLKTAYGQGTSNTGGVLAKRAKPRQDMRIDLPTIGAQTIKEASAAKLSGIGLEAGACLIVDRDAVLKAADAAGIFIYGLAPKGDRL